LSNESIVCFFRDKYQHYYEKIFSIASSTIVRTSCIQVMKKEINKSTDTERKELAMKYLGMIWLENLTELSFDDPLVCL